MDFLWLYGLSCQMPPRLGGKPCRTPFFLIVPALALGLAVSVTGRVADLLRRSRLIGVVSWV